jgi:hypothetical protein
MQRRRRPGTHNGWLIWQRCDGDGASDVLNNGYGTDRSTGGEWSQFPSKAPKMFTLAVPRKRFMIDTRNYPDL